MPTHLDILLERLRAFDPDTVVELLNITTEELLSRFRDKINLRQGFLNGEFELFSEEEVDAEDDLELDGYQIETPFEDGE